MHCIQKPTLLLIGEYGRLNKFESKLRSLVETWFYSNTESNLIDGPYLRYANNFISNQDQLTIKFQKDEKSQFYHTDVNKVLSTPLNFWTNKN